MLMNKYNLKNLVLLGLLIMPLMLACTNGEDGTKTDVAITGSCIDVGSNYALIEGYFNQNEFTKSPSLLEIGIEYSENESFYNSVFSKTNVLEGNKFVVALVNLKSSTNYYYRSCVKTNSLLYVGKTSTFKTIGEKEFPTYEGGTTAYFAYQFPVRTVILGNDIYDNTLDNQHKIQIWSTMSGTYDGRNSYVDIAVDETLCDNLFFTDDDGNTAAPVLPMPKEYYTLLDSKIPYNGDSRGYVEVQLNDAFFNDPKTIEITYVIPLVMTGQKGLDHILTGTPRKGLNPSRTNTEDWDVLAKDYVLYCVKYMNPWQARYIRRGVDYITENGTTTQVVRKDFSLISDWEHYKDNPVNQNDEVCSIHTKNMTQAIFPVSFKTSSASISCNLILSFNGNLCTISTDDENVTATGSGEFIEKGTERAEYRDYQWGNYNGQSVFDILRLAYDVKFDNKNIQVSTTDTLVVQTRESNKREFFSPKYVKQ